MLVNPCTPLEGGITWNCPSILPLPSFVLQTQVQSNILGEIYSIEETKTLVPFEAEPPFVVVVVAGIPTTANIDGLS